MFRDGLKLRVLAINVLACRWVFSTDQGVVRDPNGKNGPQAVPYATAAARKSLVGGAAFSCSDGVRA
jgi:hypothetical protein